MGLDGAMAAAGARCLTWAERRAMGIAASKVKSSVRF